MSNKESWTRQGQTQANKGYSAPRYETPRPSWQQTQATQASFNQARAQQSTNWSKRK